MAKATEAAHAGLVYKQLRRERFYNRRVCTTTFGAGDVEWVLKPPRGKSIAKLAHQWIGPAKIVQDAGFDYWEVVPEASEGGHGWRCGHEGRSGDKQRRKVPTSGCYEDEGGRVDQYNAEPPASGDGWPHRGTRTETDK
ncbi:hypothetical protein PHMEG_00011499 [Phytophthora megakarya]|uniref:Uncharacterized protein n=1 Tax=Phytophthora megakarya TaxID=4795 RepID=A0A225WDM2_9STRA|nr:hypothetical protein PHMEG_00011499 [Phytophthora megakarya]